MPIKKCYHSGIKVSIRKVSRISPCLHVDPAPPPSSTKSSNTYILLSYHSPLPVNACEISEIVIDLPSAISLHFLFRSGFASGAISLLLERLSLTFPVVQT